MATFTMTLKDVGRFQGATEADEYDGKWYGLDSYTTYDPTHRDVLNRKIIDHFWNREIGQETVAMFKLAMRRRLNEIMPAINEHYRMSAIVVDPLQTFDMETTGTTEGTNTSAGTGTNTSGSEAKARTVLSEHPQELLAADADYASQSNDNISTSTAGGSTTTEQTDTADATTESVTKGSQGHAASLILQARQAIVNVDMMVIDELEHLFMKVWSNGDEYSNEGVFWYGYW